MSAPIIYKWRILCISETDVSGNPTWQETWSNTAPQTCPNDNAHTVNKLSVYKVPGYTIEENTVKIKEEDQPTGGNYSSKTLCVNIPDISGNMKNSDGSVMMEYDNSGNYVAIQPSSFYFNQFGKKIYYTDEALGFDINMINTKYTTTNIHEGDKIDCYIAPDTIIGALTNDVSGNQTVISVSSTVITNLKAGYKVNLIEPIGGEYADLGECLSIDNVNSTITVSRTPNTIYSFLVPTYVRMSIGMMKEFMIGPQSSYDFGTSKIGTSFIPANVIGRIAYDNRNGKSKRFIFIYEYLY